MTLLQVEELEALIKDLRWEHFEADPMGQIQVKGKLFCMRVGLHMDRPVQAIICDGQFVRIRSAEYYQDKKLHKLDPERLAESVYMEAVGQGWPGWRPFLPSPNQNIQHAGATSTLMKGIGAIAGGGGGGGGTSSGVGGHATPTQIKTLQQAMEKQKMQMQMDREIAIAKLESDKKPIRYAPWSFFKC